MLLRYTFILLAGIAIGLLLQLRFCGSGVQKTVSPDSTTHHVNDKGRTVATTPVVQADPRGSIGADGEGVGRSFGGDGLVRAVR